MSYGAYAERSWGLVRAINMSCVTQIRGWCSTLNSTYTLKSVTYTQNKIASIMLERYQMAISVHI